MALAPGNVSSYNMAPGQSMADLDLKKKMAYALMQQGMSGEPVQHWTQGLARAAQGAMGGYEMYQAEQDDKADKEKTRSIVAALSGGADGLSVPQPASAPISPIAPRPSPVAAALTAPPPMAAPTAGPPISSPRPGPAVVPTAKVWGDKEAEAAGLYEPAGGTQVAQAPTGVMSDAPPMGGGGGVPMPRPRPMEAPGAVAGAPPPAPAAGGMAPVGAPVDQPRGGMSDARRSQLISALMQTRAGAAIGQGLFVKELDREATRSRPLTESEKTTYPGAVAIKASGEPIFPPPSTNVTQNSVVNPVMAGISKQFDESRAVANSSVDSIKVAHELRGQLDSGIYTGTLANWQTGATKLAHSLGLPVSDEQINKMAGSETFMATAANLVRAKIKSFGSGSGITDGDRDYTRDMVGGNIKLDETSMRRILDINEKLDRAAIRKHNAAAEKILAHPDAKREIGAYAPLMTIEEPPEYVAPTKAPAGTAAQPATAPAAAPQTAAPSVPARRAIGGKNYIKRNGQWFEE